MELEKKKKEENSVYALLYKKLVIKLDISRFEIRGSRIYRDKLKLLKLKSREVI